MSDRIEYSTEELNLILGIIGECAEAFGAARVRIGNSMELNLETAGKTELGRFYANGIVPGASALAQLLDHIWKELEGAHGPGILMVSMLEQANSLMTRRVGGGGGRGGRR